MKIYHLAIFITTFQTLYQSLVHRMIGGIVIFSTTVGHQGPLGARFEELCGDSGLQNLVVGRFGDSSEHLHLLIKGMAEARALFVSRSAGRPLSDNETGVILSSYRRILSCRFIRSQESCLLARLGHMDDGARQAAGRRRLRMREEEMARHEAAAYHTAYVRGRGVHRAGQLPRPWPLNHKEKHSVKL